MKVWELRDGLAAFDGDDPVMLRIHAAPSGFPQQMTRVDAEGPMHVDTEWVEMGPPVSQEERWARRSGPPRVRHAVIQASLRERKS